MKKHVLILFISITVFINTLHTQTVTTFAGSGTIGSTDDVGTAASFNYPSSVCTDASGNIYVTDQSSHKIRKITPSGIVTTFAGSGTAGSTNGTGTAASFNVPAGVCTDAFGNIYVADFFGNRIRKITPSGVVTTFAGSGIAGSTDATGVAASFNYPLGLCVDASNNIYVADQGNHKIRKITPLGVVTTFAGSGSIGSTDANGISASFYDPAGVCADASGNIYVADQSNQKIRKITPSGMVTTFAGSGITGSTDATGSAASFNSPTSLFVDAFDNIYVTDFYNHKIRKINLYGIVTTLAGSGSVGSTDAIGTGASFNFPVGVCIDASGNIYVADRDNHKIRKITVCTAPNTPTNSTIISNTQVCYGNTTTLTAIGTGTVSWFTSSTGGSAISSGSNIVTSNTLTVGSYTYYAEDYTCTNSASRTAISFTVNSKPVIAVNSGSICSGNSFSITSTGANTYTVTGGLFNVSPTSTTSYSVTGTSTQGCVSSNTAVSTITVNALPTITVNSGSICSGNSFSITPTGANTYTVTGGLFNVSPTSTTSYSVTGTSTQGCVSSNTAVSTITVNALPTIAVNSGSICSGNSFSITPTGANTYTVTGGFFNVSPTSTMSYIVTGTSTQGCVSSNVAVSTVTVNELPTITVNSGSICSGNSFSIMPTGANTYTVTGGLFNVAPTSTTSYSVTGTSTQGCVSSNVAVSTVTVNALPTIAVNSGSICSGSLFSITPTGANTYTVTGGLFNVSPTSTTSYSVTGTNTQGCVSSNVAVSTVTVNALPTIAVNSGSICSGNSFSITPTGANTYTVTGGLFNVSPTSTASYSVTGISVQGCVSSNTAVSTITVSALPNITVNSGSVCLGNSFSITPAGANTYTVTGGLFNVSPTSTTSYSVTGTGAQGCISSNAAVSTVTVNALPTLSISSTNTLLCTGQTASVTAQGATNYLWNTGVTGSVLVVNPTVTTTYTVTGTNTSNCSNSAIYTQQVSLCTGINELGLNDSDVKLYPNPNNGEFTIETGKEISVVVFNLLGEVVYEIILFEGKNVLDIQDKANGMYLVKLENNQHLLKFIKN